MVAWEIAGVQLLDQKNLMDEIRSKTASLLHLWSGISGKQYQTRFLVLRAPNMLFSPNLKLNVNIACTYTII